MALAAVDAALVYPGLYPAVYPGAAVVQSGRVGGNFAYAIHGNQYIYPHSIYPYAPLTIAKPEGKELPKPVTIDTPLYYGGYPYGIYPYGLNPLVYPTVPIADQPAAAPAEEKAPVAVESA